MRSIEKDNSFAAFIYSQLIFWGLTVLSAREWQLVYLLLLIPNNIVAFAFWNKAKPHKSLRIALSLSPAVAYVVACAIAFRFL